MALIFSLFFSLFYLNHSSWSSPLLYKSIWLFHYFYFFLYLISLRSAQTQLNLIIPLRSVCSDPIWSDPLRYAHSISILIEYDCSNGVCLCVLWSDFHHLIRLDQLGSYQFGSSWQATIYLFLLWTFLFILKQITITFHLDLSYLVIVQVLLASLQNFVNKHVHVWPIHWRTGGGLKRE